MSNKNKISIIFEALGLDKVVATLSDFSKKLTNTEKTTKQTTKATEELDEETKKLGSSMQKASSDINKTAISTKNLNDTNKENKKTTSDLDTSIKNQTENYKNLTKQLEEQKKARNSLVDEVSSKENKSTEDLITINKEYEDTLKNIEKAASTSISTSKEDIEIKKKLSKDLDNAKKTNDELTDSINKGTASVNSVKKSFEMLGPIMQGIRSVQDKVKMGFEALNKSAAGIMLIIQGVSKLAGMFGGAISKGKEFSEALDKQNKSMQSMSLVISKNNKLTFESNKSLMNFAGELQKTTAYGDEFTMSLIKQGAQAGLNEEEIKRLTKVSLDLATTTGQDANTAMKDLTVGMNDIAKLTKLAEEAIGGFTQEEKKMLQELQASGKQAEATAFALEKIESAVGGAAQKEVETFAGKQKQLAGIMGDVKEEFGRVTQALAKPFLDKAIQIVTKFFDVLKNPVVVDTTQKIITGFRTIGLIAKSAFDIVIERGKMIFSLLTFFPRLMFATGQKLFELGQEFLGVGGKGEEMGNTLGNVFKGVVGFVINASDTVKNLFKLIGDAATDLANLDFDKLKTRASENANAIKESFTGMFDKDKLIAKGEELFDTIKQMHEETKNSWEEPFVFKTDTAEIEEDLTNLNNESKKTLLEMLNDIEETAFVESDIIQATFTTKKQAIENLQSIEKKALEERKRLLEEEAKIRIKNGEDINTVNIEGIGNLRDAIKQANKDIEDYNKDTSNKQKKLFSDLKAKAGEIVGSLGSIAGSINSLIQSNKKAQLESLAEYETAIDTAKQKQIDALKEFDDAWKISQEEKKSIKEETDEEENEVYIERLESEMQRSLEAGDMLAASAIANKLKELEAEKKKKAEEKVLKEKEKTEEDKMKEERAALEKKLNYDTAMAEYNKAMAEHNNQIKLAETEAQKAKADAGISMAQGIAQAAVGVATSFAQGGPILAAVGLGLAASIIGSVSAGVSQIQAAASNVESLKSSPPKPPTFAYGTSGYSLAQGESAIVGEAGAEVVRNRGGLLEVESAERTKNKGVSSGEVNVNINVYGMMFSEAIETIQEKVQETFINMKERSLNYAI